MTEIKIDSKVTAAVARALEPFAEQMFRDQQGEWTAVVTFSHAKRSEEIKTEDDFEYTTREVKIRVTDAEILTGPHVQGAEEALKAARRQRSTANTLLEGAFE